MFSGYYLQDDGLLTNFLSVCLMHLALMLGIATHTHHRWWKVASFTWGRVGGGGGGVDKHVKHNASRVGLDRLFFFFPPINLFLYSQNVCLIFLSYYLLFFSTCLLFPV